jgi:hypothetical protein
MEQSELRLSRPASDAKAQSALEPGLARTSSGPARVSFIIVPSLSAPSHLHRIL